MPDDPPARIGFAGVETFPDNFFSQEIWPLQRVFPKVSSAVVWSVLGALALGAAWYLSQPRFNPSERSAPASSSPFDNTPILEQIDDVARTV